MHRCATAVCVQVVFDRETLKYPWHLPVRLLDSTAVYIDSKAALEGRIDIIQSLASISPSEIQGRRAMLSQLAFSLQYSITDSSAESLSARGPDAVEVALAGMLRHADQQAAAQQ
jgi:hypothetical protein